MVTRSIPRSNMILTYMLQNGDAYGVILTGLSDFSLVLMVKHH